MDNENEIKKREEELFKEKYNKQLSIVRRTLLLTFGILGAVFAVVGTIMLFFGVADEESGFLVGWVFLPMGLFWLILGLILFFAIPDASRTDFAKIKARAEKYGYSGVEYLSATVEVEKEQIKDLQQRITSLESEIKELRDNGYRNYR